MPHPEEEDEKEMETLTNNQKIIAGGVAGWAVSGPLGAVAGAWIGGKL